METVLDLPNVLAVLYTKERRHIPQITGHADNVVPAYFLVRNITEKTSYFWYNEIRGTVSLFPKV